MSDEYDYIYDDKAKKADSSCFKEKVCIDAPRIYDSCSDKECVEDLRVYFSPQSQEIINQASNVRMRDVKVVFSYLSLEPVAFHKGFYSVDITFFFEVRFDVFSTPVTKFAEVSGLCIHNKNVVLYGSEGNVKIFSSDFTFEDFETQGTPSQNLPKAILQVAEPIGLEAKLSRPIKPCNNCFRIPKCICNKFGGEICMNDCEKSVYVTLGLFYIVQIQRSVQILIPAYDFCIPQKECTASDDPCKLFQRIDFPTDEFFPPRLKNGLCLQNDVSDTSGCKCKKDF